MSTRENIRLIARAPFLHANNTMQIGMHSRLDSSMLFSIIFLVSMINKLATITIFQLIYVAPQDSLSFTQSQPRRQVFSLCCVHAYALYFLYILDFTWKRLITRTAMMGSALFLAETIPHFSSILSLVGGSTVTILAYICPPIFYLRLCKMDKE